MTLKEKVEPWKHVKEIERQRNANRRSLFEAEDEIDERRQRLIRDVQEQLKWRSSSENAFAVRWLLP